MPDGPDPLAPADRVGSAPTQIVFVGHVDHGKSTLIGRLLHDTDSLADGRLDALRASSARRGLAIEWSFLLDSLQAERDQGVTIDATRLPLVVGNRNFVIVDAPGHRQFLRNMVTAAADAAAAPIHTSLPITTPPRSSWSMPPRASAPRPCGMRRCFG